MAPTEGAENAALSSPKGLSSHSITVQQQPDSHNGPSL